MCRGGQRPTRASALRSEGCASRKHRLRLWGHEAASLCIPTRHQPVSSTELTTEQKGFIQRPLACVHLTSVTRLMLTSRIILAVFPRREPHLKISFYTMT